MHTATRTRGAFLPRGAEGVKITPGPEREWNGSYSADRAGAAVRRAGEPPRTDPTTLCARSPGAHRPVHAAVRRLRTDRRRGLAGAAGRSRRLPACGRVARQGGGAPPDLGRAVPHRVAYQSAHDGPGPVTRPR